MTKENKRKGVTLVELVIVIGIMAILFTVIGISLNTIFYNRAKAGARNIYNMLGAAQTLGMSKDNIVFGIEGDSDGHTVFIAKSDDGGFTYTKIEEKKLGNKLAISARGSSWSLEFSSGNSGVGFIVIPINRTTGGFKNPVVQVAGTHQESTPCTQLQW